MASRVSRRRLAATVVALLLSQPKDRKHTLRMLAAYLVDHRRQKELDLIMLDIARELQTIDGHLYAQVRSAFALDAAARSDIVQYLQHETGSHHVELDEVNDATLLAGVIVRTADRELDTSARTKLRILASLNVNTPTEARGE